MKTISLKVPTALDVKLRAAAKRQSTTKSVLIRSALEAFLRNGAPATEASFLELAADLIGNSDSGCTDLSTNPKHMEGFGR